ncbi:MAG: sigma-70 family RNA polymerase sigma factor [Anaerolineae bacterium]|nr:sigma-70 family RNA polymerase sigma factor [Anaerolineae bacterium]
MSLVNVNDEPQLIAAALHGKLDAFNQLVLIYQDTVYTLAYRVMGEPDSAADATQETFISAYRNLSSYRGGNFKSWLLRIATNTCYDELRRRKRRPATPIEELPGSESDDGPPLVSTAVTPEEAAQQSELTSAIQECINNLQPDYRVTLVMSDIEGFNYQEIAEQTSVPPGTVKSRLSRARLAMRRCLEGVQELLPAEFRLKYNNEP